MDQSAIAVRYAKALFELSVEQKIEEQVFNDMKYLQKLLVEEDGISGILTSKAIDVSEKQDIFNRLFVSQINPLTARFLSFLIQKRREDFLLRIILEYTKHYNNFRNQIGVTVKSAIPLSQSQLEGIESAIAIQFKKTPTVENVVDDSLIGGYQIFIDGRFCDQSVKGMLEKFEQSI